MNKKRTIILVIFMFLISTFYGCSNKLKSEKPVERQTYLMGTIVNLKIYGQNAKDASEKCIDRISEIEHLMSTNIASSEVSQINKNAGVKFTKVSDDTLKVIKASLNYSKKTNGSFDITVEPLVKLWGIGTDKAKVPSKENIDQKIKLINYNDVIIDEKNSQIMLKHKNQAIDLGGIAKGYTADELKNTLIKNHIETAFINLGGNVYVLGNKIDDTPWNIGIQNPLTPRGDYIGIVKVSNKSIVTSGNYERYFIVNGKRYHHIFDTKTGYPSEKGLLSVSVISDKSIDGDALSTSLFTLGLHNGLELANSLNGVDAIFVTDDKSVFITNHLKKHFELTNTEFHLRN